MFSRNLSGISLRLRDAVALDGPLARRRGQLDAGAERVVGLGGDAHLARDCSPVSADDEHGAGRPVRDPLADAAQRADAVEPAVADDDELGVLGRGEQHVDRTACITSASGAMRSTASRSTLSTLGRHQAQLRFQAIGERAGDLDGTGRLLGAVDAHDDGLRKLLHVRCGTGDEHEQEASWTAVVATPPSTILAARLCSRMPTASRSASTPAAMRRSVGETLPSTRRTSESARVCVRAAAHVLLEQLVGDASRLVARVHRARPSSTTTTTVSRPPGARPSRLLQRAETVIRAVEAADDPARRSMHHQDVARRPLDDVRADRPEDVRDRACCAGRR